MKVIFDCNILSVSSGNPTGIQRVVLEIGRRLCGVLPSARLGIFDHSGECFVYDLEHRAAGSRIEINRCDIVVTAGPNWDFPTHNSRLLALREQEVKLVPLFYDIIPLIMPFSYGPGFPPIYERWLGEMLANSDISLAISENTRNDLIKYANQRRLRIPSIYPIRLGDNITVSDEEPSTYIHEIVSRPYILSVGTLEYRKNHVLLLNAYRYMIDAQGYRPPPLIIVGKKGWLDHDIVYQAETDPRLNGLVSILQYATDADLCFLYQNAMFTVYPSFYEGWGLPVTESLCFGKPCVASGTSSMLEIAPGLVKHAHPLRLDEWVAVIRDLVDNPDVLRQAKNAILTEYKRASWTDTALQIRKVLQKHYPQLRENKS